jgi:plastocyanin
MPQEILMPRFFSLGMIVAVLAGCSGTAAPTASPTLAPAAITIEAQGPGAPSDPAAIPVGFMPSTFEIQAGDIVRLVDAGDTEHDLTIDVGGGVPTTTAEQKVAVQIHVDLLNKTNQAAIDLPPGTYRFYCSIDLGRAVGHAKNGMVGTVTVH